MIGGQGQIATLGSRLVSRARDPTRPGEQDSLSVGSYRQDPSTALIVLRNWVHGHGGSVESGSLGGREEERARVTRRSSGLPIGAAPVSDLRPHARPPHHRDLCRVRRPSKLPLHVFAARCGSVCNTDHSGRASPPRSFLALSDVSSGISSRKRSEIRTNPRGSQLSRSSPLSRSTPLVRR